MLKHKLGFLGYVKSVFLLAGSLGFFGALLPLSTPMAVAATGINRSMNYQGRLLTATGAIVPDGFYNLEFKIYQDGTGCVSGGSSPCSGTLKWTEDWVFGAGSPDNRVKVTNGYFSVQLGTITSFSGIDWNQDTLWLSINIGNTSAAATFGAASGDGEMLPFKRLTAAPYALNADLLDGFDSTAFGDATAANQTTILNRIGTNADAAGTTTLFARLARIDDTDLGATSDAASSSGTIFARLADLFNRVSSMATNIGTNTDSSGTTTLFARLAQISDTKIGTTTDTGGTSSAGTVMAKLNALITAGGGSGKTLMTQTFTASGTWTKPSGVNAVDVLVVGGGGGGGGGTSAGAGGGGGSGYAIKYVDTPVTANVSVTVGGGGSGGAAGNPGGGGGQSSFDSYKSFGGCFGSTYQSNGGSGYGPSCSMTNYPAHAAGYSGGGTGGDGTTITFAGGGGGGGSGGGAGANSGAGAGGYLGSGAFGTNGGGGTGGFGGGFWWLPTKVGNAVDNQLQASAQTGSVSRYSSDDQPPGGGGGGIQNSPGGDSYPGTGGNGSTNCGGSGASGGVNGNNCSGTTGGTGASGAANSGSGGGGGGSGTGSGGAGGSGGSGYVIVTWWQ